MTTDGHADQQGALGARRLRRACMPWRDRCARRRKPVKVARHRAALRPLGAPGHADQVGRRDWRRARSTRQGGIKSMGGAKLEAGRDRRRRLGREGEERRAAHGRAGARRGRRHGRVALDLHARRHRSDRARPDSRGSRSPTRTASPIAASSTSSRPRRPAGRQSIDALPTILELAKAATGKAPATVGIIGDNTPRRSASSSRCAKAGCQRLGIKLVVDETYHAAALRRDAADPEGALDPAGLPAVHLDHDLRRQARPGEDERVPPGKGVIPVIANGAHMGAPEVLKNVPADLIEGVMFIVANWGSRVRRRSSRRSRSSRASRGSRRTALAGYGHIWILKEALERAGVADKVKVDEEIHKLDLKTGRAADTPSRAA